ncbi:hypothetical protein VB773_16215 [Haloarculaceae archaeon H-GB2-1]|nr:hypothetical protein [Haloarculaceae archaeon H-GB1-1]MEA5387479.1 hypothetical protein [Haloarculaceae archaeon H-GB11]MEA5408960.1 hypothetical protein [Haloarculaceae archaeon H-GB2-1]
MANSFEFGLRLVAGNPNLTFIFFMGLSLLTVISSRFGFYAYRNMQSSDLPAQRAIWEYLVFVGGFATLYGVLGLLEIVSSFVAPQIQALMVGFVLVLTLSFRQIHHTVSMTGTEVTDGRETGLVPGRKAVEGGFVLVVLVLLVGMTVAGQHPLLVALEGVTTIAVAAYGLRFGTYQTSQARVKGTMIDTLLRHLLPVLVFGALIPIIDLATLGGLDRAVVLHVRVVFVIVTATALMTATIKLKQNLASL